MYIPTALNRLTRTITEINTRLYGDADDWRAGYWGRIPYLLCLRCLIAFGFWLRFWLHEETLPIWLHSVPLLAIIIAFIVHAVPSESAHRIYPWVVIVDILLISIAYDYTRVPESDFFLFYFLPIFTAAEFLTAYWVLGSTLVTSIAFLMVLYNLTHDLPELERVRIMLRVYLPREVFYVAVCLITALRLRRERDTRTKSVSRQNQIQALLAHKRELQQQFDIKTVLSSVVTHAQQDLGADNAVGLFFDPKATRQPIQVSSPAGTPLNNSTLAACRAALDGEAKTGAVPIVTRSKWIGALAVGGIDHPAALVTSHEYLSGLADLVADTYTRAALLDSFREIGDAAALAVDLSSHLDATLDHIIYSLGFEYATISLVDTYRNDIRTVRGRNVPPGWIASAVHSLSGNDIQAVIVRMTETRVSDSYEPCFDWYLFDRYNHASLARVFAPITVSSADDTVTTIGVIEAGCKKDRRAQILDPQVHAVTELGAKVGPAIARALPSVLLEVIARNAQDLVGADSASLHVFRDESEFLVAGSGRADKAFLARHPPSNAGSGRQAMQTGQHIVHDHLPDSKRALRDEGVVSMAAFPFSVGSDIKGVLYLHHWKPQGGFTAADTALVDAFIPQIELAIQHYLFIQDISKSDQQAWMNTGLQNVIASLASDLDTSKLLERLASETLYMLDAKSVVIYQYVQETRDISRAVTAGHFTRPEKMVTDVRPGEIVSTVLAAGENRFISDATTDPFLNQPRASGLSHPRFCTREEVASCAILILRSPHNLEIVGCLFVNYDSRVDFDLPPSADARRLARVMAAAAAVAIQTSRLHTADLHKKQQTLRRREDELASIATVAAALLNQAPLMQMKAVSTAIVDAALHVMGRDDVTVGQLFLWNPETRLLELTEERGAAPRRSARTVPLGVGIVGWVGKQHHPALSNDVSRDARYIEFNHNTRSELAVPILDGNTLLGVLNLEHRSLGAFTEDDQAFLQLLAVFAMLAATSEHLGRTIDKQAIQALALSTVAVRVQSANLARDTALRLVLTGVTSRDGLGFSRASIFEVDPADHSLVGSVAIGSLSAPAALDVWERIRRLTLSELLSAVESMPTSSEFEDSVRRIRIPLAMAPETVRRCLSGGLDCLPGLSGDVGTEICKAVFGGSDTAEVVLTPIRGRERTLGLLIADRQFLPMEPPYHLDCRSILIAFAELAALIVEGAALRQQITEDTALENWREATSRVAHVIKRSVYSAQSFSRDLLSSLARHDLAESRQLVDILIDHCDAMIRQFSRMSKLEQQIRPMYDSPDIIWVLRHLVDNSPSKRICDLRVPEVHASLQVRADSSLLPIVFEELLSNAETALRGTPDPKVTIDINVESAAGLVFIDFRDNGPGIPDVIKKTLFEPYVSKAGGTGLGLAIVKQVLAAQNASIVLKNPLDARGAHFRITMEPARKEEQSHDASFSRG